MIQPPSKFASFRFGKTIAVLLATLVFLTITPGSARESSATNTPGKLLQSIPMTGTRVPSMDVVDRELCQFMKTWKVPGASIAIVKNGKLVYSRGYGYANFLKREQVQPNSRFRIGSISKILTSVAVLKMIEEGKLKLTSSAIKLLNYPLELNPDRRADSRLQQIKIAHLLDGTAGWDRANNGDPMFVPIVLNAAQEFSNSLRPTPEAIIRYEFTRPLDFSPGTRYCYSNLGYSMLGEIISKVSGKKYAQYIQDELLTPLGITSMSPGKTRVLQKDEVSYYGFPGESNGPSVFPNIRGNLPLEYGGDFYLEAMTADCGWISSTPDVAKLVASIFGKMPVKSPLSPETRRMMISRPKIADWEGAKEYFSMGWEVVEQKGGGIIIKKDGSLPGTSAVVVYHPTDGSTCAISFNSRPLNAIQFKDETLSLANKILNGK